MLFWQWAAGETGGKVKWKLRSSFRQINREWSECFTFKSFIDKYGGVKAESRGVFVICNALPGQESQRSEVWLWKICHSANKHNYQLKERRLILSDYACSDRILAPIGALNWGESQDRWGAFRSVGFHAAAVFCVCQHPDSGVFSLRC